jgi:hypothetical protein
VKLLVLVALLGVALASASAAGAARVPGYAGCRAFTTPRPKLVVRPRSLVLACADANFYATGIRWTTWKASSATGSGTAHLNDCDPYCAAGHFRTYRIALRLGVPRRCHGRLELTQVTWSFPGRKPAGPRRGSQTFRCA